MTEKTLASAIDELAKRRAKEFITEVKDAVQAALKDKWRPKVAGGSAFMGEDIKNVLAAYAASVGQSDSYRSPSPTNELVSLCRATILSDLLSGLPRLKELALMQAEAEAQQEYQGAGHFDHHQD